MPTKERRLREEAKRSGQRVPSTPPDRRPTVGDWVEIVKTEKSDEARGFHVGDVVKIVEDDATKTPYLIEKGKLHRWMEEDQVRITDKRPKEALEPRPRTEEHLFREPPHSLTGPEETASCRLIRFIPSNTVTLPTSFASEVARAQAIADAEAEGKKWHEGSLAKYEEFAHKIAALIKEQNAVAVEDANAQQDHENRLEYLRSLRVRQDR